MNNFSFLHPLFITSIIIFLADSALAVDPRFRTCVPTCCGSVPNISYPFRIDSQPSYCGYPSFKLTCKNEEPILQLFAVDYIVRNISYQDKSLAVLNAGWLGRPCPLPAHNLTLSTTPFSISPSNRILSFFFNCTDLVPQELERHDYFRVPCISSHTGDSFAVLDYSQKLDPLNLSGKCEPSVTLPVLKESYEKLRPDGNYSDLVEKGFLLEWTAVDCSTCRESGGQCGYNKSLSRFQCYCADRSHLVKCRSNTKWRKKKILLGTLPALGGSILLFLFIWLYYHAR